MALNFHPANDVDVLESFVDPAGCPADFSGDVAVVLADLIQFLPLFWSIMFMKRSSLLILMAAVPMGQFLMAQEVPISNSTLTICSGFLVDTGLSAGNSSPNQDITMCICPGDETRLLSFDPAALSIGEGDSLRIFEGCGTEGDLLQVWTANELVNGPEFIHSSQVGGCLSVHFTSDSVGSSNFVLEMTCIEVCELLDVEIEAPMGLQQCTGSEFEVIAHPIGAAYSWDFQWYLNGESLAAATDTLLSLSLENPGVYEVNVGYTGIPDPEVEVCTVLPNEGVHVVVAPPILFPDAQSEVSLCEGDEFTFEEPLLVDDSFWQGGEFVAYGVGIGFQIPDDQSQCFSSQLIASTFQPQLAVVDAASEISDVYVNMEHSFMGDLTVSLICPNGQSMVLHAQGGGGTFLGVPVDNDATPQSSGEGYDYFWSPDAVNGTWAENSGGTLPAGTYEAAGNWSQLNGCPYDGEWTLEACDSWGSDNGFIFEWGIHIAADQLPELELGYEAGLSCDSLFWVAPNGDAFCNGSTFVPESGGAFVLNALDSWGCNSTHSMSVLLQELGCTDEMAYNFSESAQCDDGSCTYFNPECDTMGDEGWEELPSGWYPGDTLALSWGEFVQFEGVFNAPSVWSESGQSFPISNITWSLSSVPEGLAASFSQGQMMPGGQVCFDFEGAILEEGVHPITLTCALFITIFGVEIIGAEASWTFYVELVNASGVIAGCTYSNAWNYSPLAMLDDGSCEFLGCTDLLASNYASSATFDDGSCWYESAGGCLADANGDGLVNTSDLLVLLGEFGTYCE